MVFNTSTVKDFEPIFQVDNTEIQVVEETKLLGFLISSNLKWHKHVEMVTKKA